MREIETESFSGVVVPEDFGPAPQLQWLKIADLVVDDNYQRAPSTRESRTNIRRIAEQFDWRRFAPVIVSPVAGGRYAIIDGQHRCTGAALCGIDQVLCNVVMADRREQAEAFRAINGNVTRVTPGQILKARINAGDPEALRVEAAIVAGGCRMLFSNREAKRMAPNETTATSIVVRAVAAHGAKVLSIALRCIVAATPPRFNLLRSDIVQAYTEVLADHREWLTHPELLAVAANFKLLSAHERAQVEAKRTAGTTTNLNLQAELVAYLARRMPRARAAE